MGITSAAEAAAKSGSSLTFPILIVLVFVGFYFLMIRPQRRRQQQVQQQQKTVAPGAQVRTTAGMYATVVEVDDNDVVLEVAPGVEVRYLKRAIAEVITPGDEETEVPADGEFDEPEEIHDEEADGTPGDSDGVKSAEEGLVDSSDDLAKSDKGNVH
jgi:preprotein translocase subunit YajC